MEKEILYRFFDGLASTREQEKIKEWMEASGENRKEFLDESIFHNSVLLLGDVKKKRMTRRDRLFTLVTNLSKVAAIVLAVLAIQYVYKTQFWREEGPLAMQTIMVPAGQRVNLVLPDGTDVWLNARTTLRYPVNFSTKNREVWLDGEGYFDVTKNEKAPFMVATDRGVVEVTGTELNVEAYSFKKAFVTTLLSGRAKVIANDPEQFIVMEPDTKVKLEQGVFTVDSICDYNYYRWTEGLICFRKEPFESIMEELERYFGIRVEVKNEQVKSSFYTGKLRHSDGIDYALRVLQNDIPFHYRRDEENQIIYIL
ncbi:MAG: FecR family protein [Tannerellaceae bacterium]|nr:FecR family protein [Tannerellaceae bacterium]